MNPKTNTVADASTSVQAQAQPAAMRFILVTVLIDMMAIGLIVPVLPVLVGSFTSNPTERALWYGVVAFAFGFANFIGSPILGALSDRYGRRPVLLLGFCGLALNFFATAMATQLWVLIAVRLVGGAMQSNAAIANAYVADITEPKDRARRFGQLGAMFGIGFILGPVMGGILGDIDLHYPFYAAGVMALINLAYGYFVLPESLPLEKRRNVTLSSLNPFASLKKLTALKGVGPLIGVIALSNLAQFVLYTTWVLYTTYRFNWTPRDNGWSLFAVGVMAAVVQGFLLSRLIKFFGATKLVRYGLVSSSIAYLLWGLSTQGWMMYAVIFCNVLSFAVAASVQSIVSNAASAKEQGETAGAVSSVSSLMAVFAPALGAPLMSAVSHLPANDWRVGAPMYFCAALQFSSMLLATWHFSRTRNTTDTPTRTM
jgi:MFS transporter, DHA1 family, tetracycline resistance protein